MPGDAGSPRGHGRCAPLFLLDDLFLWLPLKGLWVVAEQIQQRVGGDAEEEARLRKRLLELRLGYEMDEIDEATYQQAASDMMRRLRELHELAREEAVDEQGEDDEP